MLDIIPFEEDGFEKQYPEVQSQEVMTNLKLDDITVHKVEEQVLFKESEFGSVRFRRRNQEFLIWTLFEIARIESAQTKLLRFTKQDGHPVNVGDLIDERMRLCGATSSRKH
jgi:hypothetical protein